MSIKKCTFCGREGSEGDNTKVVGGYTILDSCTDCEKEILADTSQEDLEDKIPILKDSLGRAILTKRMFETSEALKSLDEATDKLLAKSDNKLRKAQYVIIDSKDRYFKEISKLNKIVYADSIEEATKMDFSDTEELIPLIEHYTGCVAVAEPISQTETEILKRVRAIVNNYDEEPTYNGEEYNVLQESDTEYLIEINDGFLTRGKTKVWKNKKMFKDIVNS